VNRVDVVAAIIERDGRFLVGKRSPHKKSAPGVWQAIVGRIEADESERDAVVREVLEETGLRVEPLEKVCECDNRAGTARIHWWAVKARDDAPARRNDEHSELRWVTIDEMRRLDPVFEEDVEIFARFAAH
jgi:8-oxo-dGTP pyrophosphatase MutT (NUDIX family)